MVVYFGIASQLGVKFWRHSKYLLVVAKDGWNGADGPNSLIHHLKGQSYPTTHYLGLDKNETTVFHTVFFNNDRKFQEKKNLIIILVSELYKTEILVKFSSSNTFDCL